MPRVETINTLKRLFQRKYYSKANAARQKKNAESGKILVHIKNVLKL